MRKLLLWVAALAVLMGALAPALSQAVLTVQGRDQDGLFYVCSTTGARWVSADASQTRPDSGGSGNSHDAGHLFEHCPYCSIHALGLGTPPVDLRVPELPRTHAVIGHDATAAPTLKVWSDALSRGPPTNA